MTEMYSVRLLRTVTVGGKKLKSKNGEMVVNLPLLDAKRLIRGGDAVPYSFARSMNGTVSARPMRDDDAVLTR
jgi:hypothetical protein